jgi:hypothetical protein
MDFHLWALVAFIAVAIYMKSKAKKQKNQKPMGKSFGQNKLSREVEALRRMGARQNHAKEYFDSADKETAVVQSFTNPHKVYLLNLSEKTCTCKDFETRRNYPKNSKERFCKHLLLELGQKDLKFAKKHNLRIYTGIILGEEVKAKVSTGKDWADIYFKGECHGFNIERRIWTTKTRSLDEFYQLDTWAKENI